MAIGRAARRAERRERIVDEFGEAQADAALDLLELLELAWHDAYGDITPPEEVIDDVLVLSRGKIPLLISAARLAVSDWRDTRVGADQRRAEIGADADR